MLLNMDLSLGRIIPLLAVIGPPTFKFPPMPTPPVTTNAPVLVEVEDVQTDVFGIKTVPLLVHCKECPVGAPDELPQPNDQI